MLRLVTIPISHYCEKARWALDRAGIGYREERHVQGIHQLAARRAGGGITVPVLVTPAGVDRRVRADPRMGRPAHRPARRACSTGPRRSSARCWRCARRFDERLGPAGRRLVYVHMFGQRELMLRFNDQGVPAWEDRMLRIGLPLFKRLVSRVLDIRPGVERAATRRSCGREFDHAAELLSDGRPYLCGERFTAADLTFAALCAPVLMPPGYGVPLPQPEILPEATARLVRRAREHPAGAHALRMYAEHRRAVPATEPAAAAR